MHRPKKKIEDKLLTEVADYQIITEFTVKYVHSFPAY